MKPEEVALRLAEHPTAIRSVRELFRLAHLAKFGRDLSPSHAEREWVWYRAHGCVPMYVKDYLDQFKI